MHERNSFESLTDITKHSFPSPDYALKKLPRHQKFSAPIERVVPWARLILGNKPLYPMNRRVDRQPTGIARILRLNCPQQWRGLVDEAFDDARYDSRAQRAFAGSDLSRESVPDAITLLKFRRLLLETDLTTALFETERRRLMRASTIVDLRTFIAAPRSNKKEGTAGDPRMHKTKNGTAWHIGMDTHDGVYAESGLLRSVGAAVANVNDVTLAGAPLHSEGTATFDSAGYGGANMRVDALGPNSRVAMPPGAPTTQSDTQVRAPP